MNMTIEAMPNAQSLPSGTLSRLSLFADWTGTNAPALILDGDGVPAERFMCYAQANGLNLDWLFMADEKELVMQVHRAAKEARA